VARQGQEQRQGPKGQRGDQPHFFKIFFHCRGLRGNRQRKRQAAKEAYPPPNPPEERSGSFFFALAVRAIFAPVALGLGLGLGLLLGGASGVPEAGVARLDGRDDCQASPPAL
jgi:hypothetical protein